MKDIWKGLAYIIGNLVIFTILLKVQLYQYNVKFLTVYQKRYGFETELPGQHLLKRAESSEREYHYLVNSIHYF